MHNYIVNIITYYFEINRKVKCFISHSINYILMTGLTDMYYIFIIIRYDVYIYFIKNVGVNKLNKNIKSSANEHVGIHI